MRSKSQLVELEARRNEVRRLLMEGKTKSEIVSYVKKNYGVSIKSTERDMKAVRDDILENYKENGLGIIEDHMAKYNHIYKLYMDKGTEEEPNMWYDPEKASKMLEKVEKLLNIRKDNVTYVENQQNNLQVNNNNMINLLNGKSVEELQDLLAKLE